MNTTSTLTDSARETLETIIAVFKRVNRARVFGHVRPDGDCIGSLLGMHHILNHYGIAHELAAPELSGERYGPIPGFELIRDEPSSGFEPDVTIYVDNATPERSFAEPEAPDTTINIDHHAGNSRYAEVNWIEGGCAAVGEMLFDFARHAQIEITPDFATALLLALLTDTGSFRYSNVRARHFDITGDLIRAGGDLMLVNRTAFEGQRRESIQIAGEVYSSISFQCEGKAAWSELRAERLESFGGSVNVPENLVSELRAIRGVEVAVLFTELRPPGLRASLRGTGRIDVSAIAAQFGGGGHAAAAGITLSECDYESNRLKILAAIEHAVGC